MLIKLTSLKLVHEISSILDDASFIFDLFDEGLTLFILLNQASNVRLHFGFHKLSAFDLFLKHFNLGIFESYRGILIDKFLFDLCQAFGISFCGPL